MTAVHMMRPQTSALMRMSEASRKEQRAKSKMLSAFCPLLCQRSASAVQVRRSRTRLLRKREDVERLSALRDLDVRHNRCGHVARAAAAEARHHGDVLTPVDAEAHRIALR